MKSFKHKLLIADEKSVKTKKLISILRDNNFDVSIVEDGQHAYEHCVTNQPSILITEINIPTLNGIYLIKKLNTNPVTRKISIIVTSRQVNLDDRLNIIKLDIDDYVYKPYYPEELAVRVECIVNEIDLIEETQRSLSRGFYGNLQEMDVSDLIQILELGEKSAIIMLNRVKNEGLVYINKGRVVHAIYKNFTPERALYNLMTWSEGGFRVKMGKIDCKATLFQSNKEIFANAQNQIRKKRELVRNIPALSTVLVTNVNDVAPQLTREEKFILTLFSKPKSIISVLDESHMDDIETLKNIKSLSESKLLVQTKLDGPCSSGLDEDTVQIIQKIKNQSIDKYSKIISFFRKHHRQNSIPKTEESSNNGSNSDNNSKNHYAKGLSRADLMLFRESLTKN